MDEQEKIMILVEIYVISINEYCDFLLNEKITVEQAIEEICKILEKKYKNSMKGMEQAFSLCSMDYKEILPRKRTLFDCKIKNGSRLLFV